MRCTKCEVEIETDDNFCWNCGHWTPKGYKFLSNRENIKSITRGEASKQGMRFILIFVTMGLSIILFVVSAMIKGNDIFKPIFFLKRQIDSYFYGYNTAMIKTDNTYEGESVLEEREAYEFIVRDLKNQSWKCSHDIDTVVIENTLEKELSIPSVNFCDISYAEAEKIKKVIDEMYGLFPNIEGKLTNISITNAKTNSEYIAYFQPKYEFVNSRSSLDEYNRVNKTQILLNSYYFLNDELLSSPLADTVGESWYIEDATWESTIAHELGHYITYVTFLKSQDVESIVFVDSKNARRIEDVQNTFDHGGYQSALVHEAFDRCSNCKEESLENSIASISKYAGIKDDHGNVLFDETIAEAVHDYYLHGRNANALSQEIVNILLERLGA